MIEALLYVLLMLAIIVTCLGVRFLFDIYFQWRKNYVDHEESHKWRG
jgi:hypothetical protein